MKALSVIGVRLFFLLSFFVGSERAAFADEEADKSVNERTPTPEEGADPETAAASAADQQESPLTVTLRVEPEPSHIADLLKLTIWVAYPKGYSVNLPTGLKFSPLEQIKVEEGLEEASGAGLHKKSFVITLQHFSAEEGVIPSFPITYLDAKGNVQTYRVPAKAFSVDSLLANEDDPKRKEEDEAIALDYPNRLAEVVILSALAASLFGALVAWFLFRMRRREDLVVLPPPIPAHIEAFGSLDQLDARRESLFAEEQVPDYYLELTEITKRYLERRFGVDALDRTTSEIRGLLLRSGTKLEPLSVDSVVRFLQDCDLVKFARFMPSTTEGEEALEEVRRMVKISTPLGVSEDSKPDSIEESDTASNKVDENQDDREKESQPGEEKVG